MTDSSTSKPQIAFIGLGKMGHAMAANLQRSGYPLVVWNRTAEKAAPFRAAGAVVAETAAAAARGADIVISSMADDAALKEVTTGPDGILSGMRAGAIHVGTSTVSPDLSDELGRAHAAAGGRYIAAPVVGRVPAAEAAQLATFVAGDAEAIETARPVITTYAPRMVVVGERQRLAGVAKLIANFLQVSAIDLMGQSLALGERSGLPPDFAPQVLASFFANPGTREYIAKIGQRDFDDVGFTAAGGLKDVTLMIATAGEVGLRLSSAETVRAKLEAVVERGWRDKDWSSLTEIDRG